MRWWIVKHIHEIAWYSKLHKITNTDWMQSFNKLTIFQLVTRNLKITVSSFTIVTQHEVLISISVDNILQFTNTPQNLRKEFQNTVSASSLPFYGHFFIERPIFLFEILLCEGTHNNHSKCVSVSYATVSASQWNCFLENLNFI